MGFDAPIPFDLPTAISQVNDGEGTEPGGFADDVELANAAYGQAETFVTPLQMALVASTVANDGVLMQPRLVTAMEGKRSGVRTIGASRMGTVVGADDAEAIKAAMVRAVEGAARRAVHARAPRSPASPRPASPARPSSVARASRTPGSSGSRRPRRRPSPSRSSSSRPAAAERSQRRSRATS